MLSGAILPAFVIYSLRNERRKPAVLWFQFVMVSGMAWSILFGVIALVDIPEFRFVATNFLLIAIPSSAIFFFLFSYEFTFKKKVPKAAFLLFIPVGLMFVSSWFNPYNLIYTMSDPHLTEEILIPANERSIRPIINVGMGFLLVIMAAGMVFGELMSSQHKGRRIQAFVILFSSVLVGALGAIKVLNFVPPYFDPTPIGWAVSGLLFTISINRYQFLELSFASQDQIMNIMNEIILVFDSENTIIFANAIARNTFNIEIGMTKEEYEKKNTEFMSVIDDDTTEKITINRNTTNKTFNKHSFVLDFGRGAKGQIIILRDITELDKKEQQLKYQNERLDGFVDEVSHDLRSPLTVAFGHLELARTTENATDHLNSAEDALQRMEQLIQDILAKARGNQDLNLENISIKILANTAWSNVETGAGSLNIETGQSLKADSGLLLQLFENLFRNSIQHGGNNVSVRVGTTESGFFIADDGPGIPKHEREYIFNRGVTYSDQGTGYGLAIVMDIVTEHDWSISVSESESGGAYFEIKIMPSRG